MAAPATAMRTHPQPHAVVVPYPTPGNINPALQLAKLLHLHGVHVTFVNTEHNHRLVQDAEGAAAVRGLPGFRFESIPDGLSDADRASQDYGVSLSVSTSQRCAAPLRALIARLNNAAPRVTCVVPTALMSFALDVARELGIPSMVLWGCSAGALVGHMWLRQLREQGLVPVNDARELETVVDWVPGLPPMPLGDFSSFLRKTHPGDPGNFGLRFSEAEANNCTSAGVLLLNTYEELEPGALAALRAVYARVYTVGPLGSLLLRNQNQQEDDDVGELSLSLSLWRKDDARCLAWLDAQEPGSVVYVSFGSLALVTPAQVTELACGLAAAGHPFLWSARDGTVEGEVGASLAAALPPEFLASTGARCFLTAWCAQEEVLRHRAVGCFLTHAGWNSMCEAVAAGVPMVCWPGFADQYTNSRLACDVWRVGARLLDDELTRDQVARRVREVMQGQEMKERAAGWKAKAEEAASSGGGTSYQNMQRVVEEMRNSITTS